MDFEKTFADICVLSRSDIFEGLSKNSAILGLYCFYHYLDGDETSLDEISNLILQNAEDLHISSIVESSTSGEGVIDFIAVASNKAKQQLTVETLEQVFNSLSKEVGNINFHRDSDPLLVNMVNQIKGKYSRKKESTNFTYVIKLICEWQLPPEKKIKYINAVSSFQTSLDNVIFEIIFADDLEQEISDVENPKEYVQSGSLKLFGSAEKCTIGEEGSFISLISAKSLKQLYYNSSTRGLFASNLRFYIVNKKIDGKISECIKNEPENFVYYNNGIIITCSNFYIKEGILNLENFSIVNGGQTTNLIGRTEIHDDFPVVCKVIREKNVSQQENIEFLSKVAEASNTQKPINATDLIANRKEQRLLKLAFSEAGMFLKIKRGEKINKTLYPEAWQNATNTFVAQMIYSGVFQSPGSAKNSKSTILSKDQSYDLIFKTNYEKDFYISLQHVKVQYSNWKSRITNVRYGEPKASKKYGLAKNCDFFMFALICFYIKLFTNEQLTNELANLSETDFSNDSEFFKQLIKQNDIGTISLLKKNTILEMEKETLFDVFDFLYQFALNPAYESFKTLYPNYAYSNFVKSDKYYYQFVLRKAFESFRTKKEVIKGIFGKTLNLNDDTSEGFVTDFTDSDYRPGLETELTSYRQSKASQEGLKLSEIFRQDQLPKFINERPSTKADLIYRCEMNPDKAAKYGEEILKIIRKYSNINDFEIKENSND